MASSNFVDYVKLFCRSGKGGQGSAHLRREKFVPKGGPDGGDGGRGGHIYLKGNNQLWTLIHLKYQRHIFAGNGEPGGRSRSSGADGKDIVLEVPIGTIAHDPETGEKLCEITDHDQVEVLLKGGRGGLGNWHFKSATMQTPRFAQPGEDGIESAIVLELKILADVGLVGFPNAGKSTLLSTITAAKPKIADYPFTTLVPNIGIVPYRNNRSFVIADIPGIIEGAHEGKGLGIRFLRHIERNAMLLFMIPIDSPNIKEEYDTLLNELALFNPELLDKKRLLAITKSDMADDEIIEEVRKELPKVETVFISSVSGQGISNLKDILWKELNS
ncbi:MAG: GTPase ObgE [Bacteroidales bacterium]